MGRLVEISGFNNEEVHLKRIRYGIGSQRRNFHEILSKCRQMSQEIDI